MPDAPSETASPEPRLSVIIACRNAEEFLGVQLAALARQKSPVPFEVLVCDNGSDDGTVRVAQSWVGRLPVRVLDASGVLGAGPARNEGVRQSRGEWIAFCDADDQVGDEWVAAMCAALAEHPFVAGSLDSYRLNSPSVARSRPPVQQDGLQVTSAKVGLPHASSSNMGIHRSVFLEVGGFDPAVRYLQDTDLCWRVQLAGYPLVWVGNIVVHMRLRDTLRGMYRQGWNYGASQAKLERRYAGAARRFAAEKAEAAALDGAGELVGSHSHARSAGGSEPAGAVDTLSVPEAGAFEPVSAPDVPSYVPPGPKRGGTVAGATRLAKHFLDNRSNLGAQAWQIGYHVGHRAGERT